MQYRCINMSAHVHGLWGSRCGNGVLLMIQNLVLLAWTSVCGVTFAAAAPVFSMTGIYPLFRWIHSLFPVLLTSLRMADSSVRNRLIVEWAPCRRPYPGFCCLLWVPWSLPGSADATSGVRSATPCHGSVWLKGIFWMPCDGLCVSWDRPLSWRQTKITSGWVPGNESEVLSNSEALGFCAFVLSEGLSQLLSCLILLRTLEVYRAALSHPEATNETRHRKEW